MEERNKNYSRLVSNTNLIRCNSMSFNGINKNQNTLKRKSKKKYLLISAEYHQVILLLKN